MEFFVLLVGYAIMGLATSFALGVIFILAHKFWIEVWMKTREIKDWKNIVEEHFKKQKQDELFKAVQKEND